MNISYDFNGSTVIVTGGTRGIGKAIAEAFLRSGAFVTATYAGNEKAAAEMRAAWPSDKFEAVRFDVASYQDAEQFFKDFDTRHKSLEILINNAGIRKDSVVGMMSEADWSSVINTNLSGTFNMSKFGLMRMMGKRYGRIINISSPSGKMGFAGQANYASAKAGQVAFAKSLSKEAAKRSITVNCVSPGFIDTELLADLPADLKEQYKAQVPLNKFGSVSDIANAVLFLSSKEASYITGTVLEVAGGL